MKQGALHVDERFDEARLYLNEKALEALAKPRAHHTVGADSDGNTYTCMYYGHRCRKTDLLDGVKAISETLNRLADAGHIWKMLSTVISFDIQTYDLSEPQVVVMAYVLLPDAVYQVEMKNHKLERDAAEIK